MEHPPTSTAAQFLIFSVLAATNLAVAQFREPLPAQDAFPYMAVAESEAVMVSFQLPDGYYLYRHRFGFESLTSGVVLGTPGLPEGRAHEDEFFGAVEIYRGDIQIRIPYTRSSSVTELDLVLELQGCADIGYCYVPMRWNKRVPLPRRG